MLSEIERQKSLEVWWLFIWKEFPVAEELGSLFVVV